MTVKYILNGKEITPKELRKRSKKSKSNWMDGAPIITNTYTEHDPLYNDSCGVMKSQVGETRGLIKKHSIVGAAVMPDGQMRFTSRRARKEFLAMRGHVDFDGGFGD